MPMEYFVDCHCHMFTLADVPTLKPIQRIVDKLDGPLTFCFLPILPFARPFVSPSKLMDNYRTFIQYFESESEQSIGRLLQEIHSTTSGGGLSPTNATVLTPLVMDFDRGAGVDKLRAQVERLRNGIKSAKKDGFRILPFMGIDPERNDYQTFLGQIKKVTTGLTGLEDGDFIGVKLYPPLGFHVCPSINSRQLELYRELEAKQIPVTVHCQKGSFELMDKAEKLTDPYHWEVVMKQVPSLRINFAHFGGDDAVSETADFRDRTDMETDKPPFICDGTITRSTWTYRIIRMLKKYPNTYSDIAAFNFWSKHAVASLHWLLYLDSKGEFDEPGSPNHSLSQKLLWGSDYPMTTVENRDYPAIFAGFIEALPHISSASSSYLYPPDNGYMVRDTFLKGLLCENPRKFLGF